MSYQALYRKYRPSTLKDVIGQDIVIQILKNAISHNKIGHAYLFSGPRGIGKTSIAKLLAKTVNCLHLEDGDACGKCENCLSIINGFSPDIIEIDAASNNGVDEIREIKNKINLVPNQLKYKVYIIDEVHMLSIGAFNALLKTLEEPPEHIIFILATTDLHKVPSTIISRCQCFEFHRISNSDIVKRLSYICDNESIQVEDNVLEKIAELSEGGLRDAIGMLDKLNAYSSSNITLEDFEKVNGIVSRQQLEQFLKYVSGNQVDQVIQFLDMIYDHGKDFSIFIQNLISLCKDQCISYYIENKNSFDIHFLLSFSDLLNDLSKYVSVSSNIKTIFEIKILSFMNQIFKVGTKINSHDNKKNETDVCYQEEKIKNNDSKNLTSEDKIISREIISKNFEQKMENFEDRNQKIINNCFARADKKNKLLFETSWNRLNDYALDNVYGAAACFLADGTIRVVGEEEVLISYDYESVVNRGIQLLDKICDLLQKIYGKKYEVALVTNEDWIKEREQFISHKNQNIKYEYIPLGEEYYSNKKEEKVEKQQDSNSDQTITAKAIELFGEDLIITN